MSPCFYILRMNIQVVDGGQTLSFQMHIQTWLFLPTRNPKKQSAQLYVLKLPLIFYLLPEHVGVSNIEISATEKLLAMRQLLGLRPLIYISSHTVRMCKKANKKVVEKEPAI